MDNVKPLAFAESTEETCETLENLHGRCLKWSDMHGAEFSPTKYPNVYLVKQRSILTTPLHFRNVVLHPSPSTHIVASSLTLSLSDSLMLLPLRQKCVHTHMPSPS